MKHLSVDEMIDFVSLTELNSDALMLSATVNGHIRNCEKCLKCVQAFQLIRDEFGKLGAGSELKSFLQSKMQIPEDIIAASAAATETDVMDGY